MIWILIVFAAGGIVLSSEEQGQHPFRARCIQQSLGHGRVELSVSFVLSFAFIVMLGEEFLVFDDIYMGWVYNKSNLVGLHE